MKNEQAIGYLQKEIENLTCDLRKSTDHLQLINLANYLHKLNEELEELEFANLKTEIQRSLRSLLRVNMNESQISKEACQRQKIVLNNSKSNHQEHNKIVEEFLESIKKSLTHEGIWQNVLGQFPQEIINFDLKSPDWIKLQEELSKIGLSQIYLDCLKIVCRCMLGNGFDKKLKPVDKSPNTEPDLLK